MSPYLSSLDDIRNIQRPTDIPDVGLLSDLLWSDPDSTVDEWSPNDRGISYCFGKSVVDSFCSQFKFDLIARGHMVVEDGYEFFNRRKLVTVFQPLITVESLVIGQLSCLLIRIFVPLRVVKTIRYEWS